MNPAPVAKAFSTPGQPAGLSLRAKSIGLRFALTLACKGGDLSDMGMLAERSGG
jgi:hypothetical protein